MSDNIHVAVRVRPLIPREIKEDAQILWKVENSTVIYQVSSPSTSFCFDRVFDAREGNDVIHRELCSPIVESVMQGMNGTIFAYGQTSSGKTFTMMGDSKVSGIICMTVGDIFNAINNMPDREFLLRVSYMEIYNESVVDLFSTEERKNLKVQEDVDGNTTVCGLEEIVIKTTQDVLSWMKKGERKRHIGETNMNERSSRSHTIFRMIIESRKIGTDEDSAVTVSQFNLVDLAGSERAGDVAAERFKESVSINKSLFTLSQVISQLSENDGQFISYRASKLTRILKTSLGGNARTVIICTVTPVSEDLTLSTLKFASRAKCIKNKPKVNEVLTDCALMKRYARKIKELSKQLEEQQNEDVKAMQLELEEKDRKIENLKQSLWDIQEKLIVSNNIPEKFSVAPRNPRRETWGGLVMKPNLSLHSRDPVKSFPHIPNLPTLTEESFSTPTNFTACDFLPEYCADLLPGVKRKSDTSSELTYPWDDLSPLRFSLPKKIHVEVQTNFENIPSAGMHEEHLEMKRYVENLKKDYEELREYTSLEEEICGTNNMSNKVKSLEGKLKVLQDENIDLLLKLKCTSDEMANKVQTAEDKYMELLEQFNEKDIIIGTLNEKLLILEKKTEKLNLQVQQSEMFRESAEELKTQFEKSQESNLTYQSLVKELEHKLYSLNHSNSELKEEILKTECLYSNAQRKIHELVSNFKEKSIAEEEMTESNCTKLPEHSNEKVLSEKLPFSEQKIDTVPSPMQQSASLQETNENIQTAPEKALESNFICEIQVNILEDKVSTSNPLSCELKEHISKPEDSHANGQSEMSQLINDFNKKAVTTIFGNQLKDSKEQCEHVEESKKFSNKVSELSSVMERVNFHHGGTQEPITASVDDATFDELQPSELIGNKPVLCENNCSKLNDNADWNGTFLPELRGKQMKVATFSDQLEEYEEPVCSLSPKTNILISNKIEMSGLIDTIQIKHAKGTGSHHDSCIEKLNCCPSELQVDSYEVKELSGQQKLEMQISTEALDLQLLNKSNETQLEFNYLERESIKMIQELVHHITDGKDGIKNVENIFAKYECLKESTDQVAFSYTEIKGMILEICQYLGCVHCEFKKLEHFEFLKEQEISVLNEKMLESEDLLSGKEACINSFIAQIAEMETIVCDIRNQLEKSSDYLDISLDGAFRKCSGVSDDLKNVVKEVPENECELSFYKSQLLEIQTAFSEKISLSENLAEQLSHMQENILEYEGEIRGKDTIIVEYKNRIHDLENNIAEQIANKNKEISCLHEELKDLQGAINVKEHLLEDLEKQLEYTSTMVVQHEKEIADKNCVLSNYEVMVRDLERNINFLKEEESSSKELLIDAELKIAEYEKDIENKKCIIVDCDNDFKDIQKHYSDFLSELKASHENEIQQISHAFESEKLLAVERLEMKHKEEKEKMTGQFSEEKKKIIDEFSEEKKKYIDQFDKDLELKLQKFDNYDTQQKSEVEEQLSSELIVKYEERINSIKDELMEKEISLEEKTKRLETLACELTVLKSKNQKKNKLLNMANEKYEAIIADTVAEKEKVIQSLKLDLEHQTSECGTLKKQFRSFSLLNDFMISKLKASHGNKIQQIILFYEQEKLNMVRDMELNCYTSNVNLTEPNKNLKCEFSELETIFAEYSKQQNSDAIGLESEMCTEYESQLKYLNQELLDKSSALEENMAKLQMVESELTLLNAKYQNTAELLNEIRKSYETGIPEKEKIIQNLRHDLESKLTESDNLKKELEKLTRKSLTSLKGVLPKSNASHENETQEVNLNLFHEEERLDIIKETEITSSEEKKKLTEQFNKDLQSKLSAPQTRDKNSSCVQNKKANEQMKLELVSKYEEQLNILKQELQEKESSLIKKSETLEKLQKELTTLRVKNQKKNELLSNVNEKYKNAVADAVAEKESMIQQLKLNLQGKVIDCDILRKELDALPSGKVGFSTDDWEDRLSESMNKCKELNIELDRKNYEIEHIKSVYEKEIKNVEELHTKISEQSNEIEYLKSSLRLKSSECDSLKLLIDGPKCSCMQNKKANEQMKLELISKYEEQLNILKQELQEKESSLLKKSETLGKLQKELTTLRVKNQKKNELLSNVNEKYENAVADAVAEKESMIQQLKLNLQGKVIECDILRKELDALPSGKVEISTDDWEDRLSESMNKCKELNIELDRKNYEIEHIKSVYEKEIKNVEELHTKISEQSDEIVCLKSSLRLKSSVCDSLKLQIDSPSSDMNHERIEISKNLKNHVAKEINDCKPKTDEESESMLSPFTKAASVEEAVRDQLMLALKEKGELEAKCRDLEEQNFNLIAILKDETVPLEKNSDGKTCRQEVSKKTEMLAVELSKQKIELTSLRHERETLIGEISKLKDEIARRNKVSIESHNTVQLLRNFQNTSSDKKVKKCASELEHSSVLRQELLQEKERNDRLVNGLNHWRKKAEHYQKEVRRLTEVNENIVGVDVASKDTATVDVASKDTDTVDESKLLDQTDYSYHSGSVGKYKMYLMESELYQKNKEVGKLKKENHKLRSIIAGNKELQKSKPVGESENVTPSAVSLPSDGQNENSSVKSSHSENAATSLIVKQTSDVKIQNVSSIKPVSSSNSRPSAAKFPSDMHTEITWQDENIPPCKKTRPKQTSVKSQVHYKNFLPGSVKPQANSLDVITSLLPVKLSPEKFQSIPAVNKLSSDIQGINSTHHIPKPLGEYKNPGIGFSSSSRPQTHSTQTFHAVVVAKASISVQTEVHIPPNCPYNLDDIIAAGLKALHSGAVKSKATTTTSPKRPTSSTRTEAVASGQKSKTKQKENRTSPKSAPKTQGQTNSSKSSEIKHHPIMPPDKTPPHLVELPEEQMDADII